MKVLVTGCAGFIGSNLTDYLLDENYHVTGIDNFTDYYSPNIKKQNLKQALENDNFELIEEDIMDLESFPKVDYIFHMAAQAGVRASWGENFKIYTRNNIEATQKLLEFYKDQNIEKFVYSSSSSVYGDSDLPMNEKRLLKPVSPYGVSKLAAENLTYLYWKNYQVPTISLRYFTVYGPRQRPDMAINRFVKAVFGGDEISIYGDGNQTRDFTYIDDVIKALVLSAETNMVGEVFNVGGGSRISVNELIQQIEQIAGKPANLNYVNKEKGDVKDTWADLDKVNKLLGWSPETNIFDGLEKYITWYKNENQI